MILALWIGFSLLPCVGIAGHWAQVKGRNQYLAMLLGAVFSYLGLFIVYHWKPKEGSKHFIYKKEAEEGDYKAKIEAKRLGISIKEYLEKKEYENRKSSYENRNKFLEKMSPFGDEGMPDKYGNTWVDYLYFIIIGVSILGIIVAWVM